MKYKHLTTAVLFFLYTIASENKIKIFIKKHNNKIFISFVALYIAYKYKTNFNKKSNNNTKNEQQIKNSNQESIAQKQSTENSPKDVIIPQEFIQNLNTYITEGILAVIKMHKIIDEKFTEENNLLSQILNHTTYTNNILTIITKYYNLYKEHLAIQALNVLPEDFFVYRHINMIKNDAQKLIDKSFLNHDKNNINNL